MLNASWRWVVFFEHSFKGEMLHARPNGQYYYVSVRHPLFKVKPDCLREEPIIFGSGCGIESMLVGHLFDKIAC